MNKQHVLEVARDMIGVDASQPDQMDVITEKRWTEKVKGKKYSWCGDFATYCLMVAGCLDGGALNRVSLNGKWVPGDNIARLVRWARAHNAMITLTEAEPGDLVILANSNGDHIGIMSRPLEGGRFGTVDGNSRFESVFENDRAMDDKPIRCCIRTDELVTQNLSDVNGLFRPFPIPDLGYGPQDTLVFPLGWWYSQRPNGFMHWVLNPKELRLQQIAALNGRVDPSSQPFMRPHPLNEDNLRAMAREVAGLSKVPDSIDELLTFLRQKTGPSITSVVEDDAFSVTFIEGKED